MHEAIIADLGKRDTRLQKPHVKGIAEVVSSLLFSRTPNLMVLGATLNREIKHPQDRYQYVKRLLKNPMIQIDDVMGGYVPELIDKIREFGETIILAMDQSKVGNGLECLMVSVRIGDRALPVLWRVKETKGNIGFDIQKDLLDAVVHMLPEDVSVILMADRFYGTYRLVKWCQDHHWGYRIRLKGNLHFQHQGGLIISGDCLKMGLSEIENAKFNETDIATNIGIIHEAGHPEPWIIAMDCKPTKFTTLDYGFRWSIEPMFSDFKSRGFGITSTHITHPDRLERLLLLMTIAIYWAVSTGMFDEAKSNNRRIKKKQNLLFLGLQEACASS